MFGMYQSLLNNKKGDKKVKDRPRDKWTSVYKGKEKKCKDWIVKGDKTRADLKISSILTLSQKNTKHECMQHVSTDLVGHSFSDRVKE